VTETESAAAEVAQTSLAEIALSIQIVMGTVNVEVVVAPTWPVEIVPLVLTVKVMESVAVVVAQTSLAEAALSTRTVMETEDAEVEVAQTSPAEAVPSTRIVKAMENVVVGAAQTSLAEAAPLTLTVTATANAETEPVRTADYKLKQGCVWVRRKRTRLTLFIFSFFSTCYICECWILNIYSVNLDLHRFPEFRGSVSL